MLQGTVEYKKVKLLIRERINQDSFDERGIYNKLDPEPVEHNTRREQFAKCVLQTISTEGLSFEWITLFSSEAKTKAAYKSWCEMKPALGVLWANKIYELNTAPDDEDLAPKIAMGE